MIIHEAHSIHMEVELGGRASRRGLLHDPKEPFIVRAFAGSRMPMLPNAGFAFVQGVCKGHQRANILPVRDFMEGLFVRVLAI